MPEIRVDERLCTGCGACVDLCTGRVYRLADGVSQAVNPAGCWGCGHCVAACSSEAISHSTYPLAICPLLDPAALPSLDALVAAFRERRSARVFRAQPVPREVIRALVDVACWAPTASNAQPVDWLAFDEPSRISALSAQAVSVLAGLGVSVDYQEMLERQAGGEDVLFFHAPVVLIAHVPASDYFGRDDAVYAGYNLMLAAGRMGLGTCQIGYFKVALEVSPELRGALGLPPDRRPEVVLVLGYPQYEFSRVLPRRRSEVTYG